ncbi:GerAB/ArcD/ProY family transporter [Bacillus sp. Marseille-Q1617]|uniref:GerAB/ArcD/ProY family transporter n=1 Tax=Bacillus sp. Marseille-Q1617 TaxID=2736887 RepID=UPI00158CAB83|nr:GerAB/ArcD/ProY family transporter [Bacillus sp. Marseille-Q1617]
MKKQTKLTSVQLTFFIIQTQIGVGILGLPFNVFSVSKGDAWISVLIAGGMVQVIITLLWLLGRRFPSKSIFEYSKLLVGNVAGVLINIGYLIYGILVTSLVMMYATAIIKLWALNLTPEWVVMLLLLLPGIYLGKEKVMEISNVYVVVSGLIFLLIIVSIVVLFIYPVDWRYLFPIAASGGVTMLKGAKEAYFSMLGFELLLILYPYFKHNGSPAVLKSVSIANLFVTVVYTFLTISSLVTFSPEELKIVPQPVLYYVKSLYFQVIERIDLLFASLWIVNVITSLTSYLFLCTENCSYLFRRFKKLKRVHCTVFWGFFAYIIALLPGKPEEMDIFNTWVLNIAYVFVLAIPILFLGISFIFKKKEGKSA